MWISAAEQAQQPQKIHGLVPCRSASSFQGADFAPASSYLLASSLRLDSITLLCGLVHVRPGQVASIRPRPHPARLWLPRTKTATRAWRQTTGLLCNSSGIAWGRMGCWLSAWDSEKNGNQVMSRSWAEGWRGKRKQTWKNTARGKRGHAASFERKKPTGCETRRHHRGTQAWGRVFHRPFQGIAQAGLSGRAHDECTTTPPGVTVDSKAEINRVFYQKRKPSQHEYNSPTYGNLALHLQEYGRIATRIFVKTEGHKVKIKSQSGFRQTSGKRHGQNGHGCGCTIAP